MAMIRTLAVAGVFLVAAGMGLPLVASAQTSGQGQAVGILFLLGASRTGAQANTKAPAQKPKPAASAAPLTAKDRTGLVRVGSASSEPTNGSNGKHN